MQNVNIASYCLPVTCCSTAVVGAGAAGLNAARVLAEGGADVLLIADHFSAGTSYNAGSDKQTYYKLSLSGDADSVLDLAQTFFAGGHMHGDIAFVLAAGSAQSFLKLADLGVPFPHNEWGEFVGYKTDHDPRMRATSAGPLTSRFMAQALCGAVDALGVRKQEGSLVSLLVQDGRVQGLLLLNEAQQNDPQTMGLHVVLCGQVVLATGGAADLYQDSVFPHGQHGALGTALRAGAKGENLWSWQYGIASTQVRWNLSGSYQQVLPRYVDEEGSDILTAWFDSSAARDNAVFLKGYQWPFDARKVQGSSVVDLAVHAATQAGKRIYLDFTQTDEKGRLNALGQEAKEYIKSCGAMQDTPYARLAHMNPAAIALYASHGIDLAKDKLEIAVCAQHHNGGIAIDAHWKTNLDGLYAAGECAGAFGAYRPGGSALNETQVGSLRAAQHILAHGRPAGHLPQDALEKEVFFLQALKRGDAKTSTKILQSKMSQVAAHLRNEKDLTVLLLDLTTQLSAFEQAPFGTPKEAVQLRDVLFGACATVSSMVCHMQEVGGPCGHAICDTAPTKGTLPSLPIEGNSHLTIQTSITNEGPYSHCELVRPLPHGGGWFENVWRDYRSGKVFE